MIRSIISKYLWELSLLGLFILMIMFFSFLSSSFDSMSTILNVATAFIPIAIMSLGVTGVIVTGGIDLSVGGIGSLTSVMFSVIWLNTHHFWLAIIVALLTSIACGYLNGVIVTKTVVQPLIATLSTMFIYQSFAVVLLGQQSVSNFPIDFLNIGTGNVMNIPEQFIIFFGLALVIGVVWGVTPYGHYVTLLGNNEKVATYSGVNVNRVKQTTYMISGLFAGISGIVMVAYFSSVMGDLANANLLPAIVGCILGGVNIFGGSGSIIGVVIGSLFLGYLGQGLNFINVSQSEQSIVTGLILILAVIVRQFSGVRSFKKNKSTNEEVMPTEAPI